MRRPRWLLVVLVCGVAAAGAGPLADEEVLDRNRRLLEKWRADPDHHQRLVRDLRAFHALPPARQERMRQLDRYLHEGGEADQARRWAVVERYTAWLESLSDDERRDLRQAASAAERLALVRALRDRQWVARLPEGLRKQLDRLPAAERSARLDQLREEERWQRREWQGVGPEGSALRPAYREQFPPEVQAFLSREIDPRLSDKDKQDLRQANGKWPELANTIRRLSDRYPVYPPLPSGPVVSIRDLPVPLRKTLPREKGKEKGKGATRFLLPKEVKQASGKWPDFALAVTKWYRDVNKGKAPPPLGASRPGELPHEAQAYVQARLMPRVTAQQREELRRLEGSWPEYPRRLHELARSRQLVIPGLSLPGPPELWSRAQAASQPDVPGHVLWQFAQRELTPRDWAELGLLSHDPLGNREKVRKEYLRREKQRKSRPAPPRPFLGGGP